jgi:hypothetical protein
MTDLRQRSARPARAPDDGDPAFDRCIDVLAALLNRHLVDQMLRASRELSLDFESLVIWGLLADAAAAPAGTARPLRIRDLAQAAAIPRETVRRKMIALESAGRVSRVALGWVARTDFPGPRRRAYVRDAVERLRATTDSIGAALSDARAPARPPELPASDRRSRCAS